jgi:hypothetical protein
VRRKKNRSKDSDPEADGNVGEGLGTESVRIKGDSTMPGSV